MANREESSKKAKIEDRESSGKKDDDETEEEKEALRNWRVSMEFKRQQEMSAMVSVLTNVVSGHGGGASEGGSYSAPPSFSSRQKRGRLEDIVSGVDDHFRASNELTYGAGSSHATTGTFQHHFVVC